MKMKQANSKSDTLLVLCSASFGGPTTSALNLLYLFSKQGKAIDIFLMDHGEIRTADFAELGNLLPPIPMLRDAITNKKNLKTPLQFLRRLRYILSYKIFGVERARQMLYEKSARKLSGKYKNVIAYQEGITSDFASNIDAPNRIGWMHTDYDKLCEYSRYYGSHSIYDKYHH